MNKKEVAELAWPKGDRPQQNFYESITKDLYNKLTHIFNNLIQDKVISISSLVPNQNSSVTGRFHVITEKNSLFLRITRRIGKPYVEQKLLSYLETCNAPVNRLLISENIDFESSALRVDIRPYINGRYYNDSEEDILQLGRGLGIIHDKLQNFSDNEQIKKISISRYKRLKSVREKIINKDSLITPYVDMVNSNKIFFDDYTQNFDPLFHLKEGACILHGEIHPGNVIFLQNSNKACFIDFEEAVHTFAPVSWDIGFSVQRFILRDMPEPETVEKRIETFEKGYDKRLPCFFSTIEDISFFSITIIFDLLSNGIYTPESEFLKFIELYNNLQQYKGVFS